MTPVSNNKNGREFCTRRLLNVQEAISHNAQIMVMGTVYLHYYLIIYSLYNIYDSYRSSDTVGLS